MSVGGPAPFSGTIRSTIRIRYCSNVGPPTRLRMALAWRSQSLADIGRTAVISSSTLHVRRRSSSGSLEALNDLHQLSQMALTKLYSERPNGTPQGLKASRCL